MPLIYVSEEDKKVLDSLNCIFFHVTKDPLFVLSLSYLYRILYNREEGWVTIHDFNGNYHTKETFQIRNIINTLAESIGIIEGLQYQNHAIRTQMRLHPNYNLPDKLTDYKKFCWCFSKYL
jgi:hypothetical protein